MKRMRLPNGFGQITKISNKRLRKPYRAMITVGKTPQGRPICKLLKPEAYFKTYNDAYSALMKYNEHPYSYENSEVTFKQLYNRWVENYENEVTPKSFHSIELVEKYFEQIWHMPIINIRSNDIRQIIESADSYYYRKRIRFVAKSVFDLANEYEITDRNPAENIIVHKPKAGNTYPHKVIKSNILEELWKEDTLVAKLILIQCYTGFRPTELCLLKPSDIDFEQWLVVGGIKTDAGKNRIVPICSKIRDLVAEIYKSELKISYQNYRMMFEERLPDHLPHDPRKTFVTMCKNVKMDEYAIKRIVGHKIKDLTEDVYTEREISWLKEEMEKLR